MREADGAGGGSAAASLGRRFGPYFALDVLTAVRLDADGPSSSAPSASGPSSSGSAATGLPADSSGLPASGSAASGPPAGWSAVADLADPRTGAFARRADTVRAALAAAGGVEVGAVDERVAVSVAQLGVCARLVAPALALAVVTGRSPALRLDRVFWQDLLGGPFPLAVDGPPALGDAAGTEETASARLARGLADGVLVAVVAPFVAAVEREHPVSSKILWGNVASGLAGAAKMIGLAEPAAAGRAWGVVAAMCAQEGPLRGAGGLVAPGRFRRRSCCLIYRLAERPGDRAAPPGALCEDCVLHLRRPAAR